MNSRDFGTLLKALWQQKKFLCVGLDPVLETLPPSVRTGDTRTTLVTFNRAIVDATKDVVCAYKPNSAFYEEHGDEGLMALRETIFYIKEKAPDVPIILDAKRADIGNTSAAYARAVFDHLDVEAVTVSPYLGRDAIQPFLDRKDKGVIVLCRTSNPGAGALQDLEINGKPLFMHVARLVSDWNEHGNCGLVVGATTPEELAQVRSAAGAMPILIPGVGAQGGDLEASVQAGKDSHGTGFIISVSRSVIAASNGDDFAEAARAQAEALHSSIIKIL